MSTARETIALEGSKEDMANGVHVGNLVFVSGQVGTDEKGNLAGDGARAQAEQCFRNIERVLKQAGSSLRDVVKITGYLADLSYAKEYLDVRRAVFKDTKKPASTTVVASPLRSTLLVEVEAIAVVGSGG